MDKTVITGILLFNYFLVVVVAKFTTVNVVKYPHAYSAEKTYVHAPNCQQRFYLQFDCFDMCNQQEHLETLATPLNQYLLLLAVGLNFYYAWPSMASQPNYFAATSILLPNSNQVLTPGFATPEYPPPL